ncbi:3-oxoacyl-ACP reductase FabG [Tumebacillus permanentifrigoris]|uniref:3-oxoacyl-[acyl-carrier-protein] reductase n=1 Tax=Tumebacillus permanentifrigoris TaxID=378543 RepID=A0A316DCN9_9BACL|nr:3-oxoacyl-ACP reductase FabG [Tumebacillus permanentifrigoris]PWK15715.1 3-oxoacyl-[acyl-carrier-protein] reductase [Tumebacillus permanentifrigoris]
MRLVDQVAIITGGASGIGKETALLFAKNGAKLVIADYNEAGGQAALEELRALGTEAEFVKADVSNREDVQTIVDTALNRFGRIDILVNNAGITRDGFLVKMDPAAWDQVISINLTGVFTCTQLVAGVMMQQGAGVILNAASVVGLYGNVGQTNYAAAKAGVIGMTKSWAKELGPKGVRVNAVAPGFIMTAMTDSMPEKVLGLMEEKTPLRRLGQPMDIAKAYLFLASDDASFVNGAVLSVDGGLTL